MARIACVNGRYLPIDMPAVPVEDCGCYQFADGVYEVIALRAGRLVDLDGHLGRLERSLNDMALPVPMARKALVVVLCAVARRNRVTEEIIYLQIIRGSAARNLAFPASARPVLSVTARSNAGPDSAMRQAGVTVISTPDERWARLDIKSISLLPDVLAKQRVIEAGAYEAWLMKADGLVNEGSSTTAWIVTGGGELRIRPIDREILAGVTWRRVAGLAKRAGLVVIERPFSMAETVAAPETSLTTLGALAVTRIDGHTIGGGVAGPVCSHLTEAYEDFVQSAGDSDAQT